jgi:AP2 domain
MRLPMHEVKLYGGKAAGRVALIDDADYDLVMQYRWNVAEIAGTETKRPEGPYATVTRQSGGKKTSLRMHRLLTGFWRTDHIDHDTLNNQRYNLREATNSQNQGNRVVNLSSTSAYKGVCWKTTAQAWVAQIQVNKEHFYLGKFANEVDAARAYDVAAVEAFGEFALTNFPVPAEAIAGGTVLRHRAPGEGWVPPERLARNLEIARRMAEGANGTDLAREYGTTSQNIYYIRKQYRDRVSA